MELTEVIGYVASLFVLASFLTTVMTRLRSVAILSNVAFIAYGVLAGLTPVLVLHLVLLPVNLWRLYQIRQLVAEVESTKSGEFDMGWVLKHGKPRSYEQGDTIFMAGDLATALHLIVSGEVEVEGADVRLGEGELVGEMAVFSATQGHNSTVRCVTDVETLRVSNDTVLQLYHRDPALAFHITRLMVHRLTPSG